MKPSSQEKDVLEDAQELVDPRTSQAKPQDHQTAWSMVTFICWHSVALYGMYLCFTSAKWPTLIFNLVMYTAQILGVVTGALSLWTHRTYKAKLPLQIILMLFQSMSWQETVLNWARKHRFHHEQCDTDAARHKAMRRLYLSDIFWLMMKKHTDVNERGTTDLSDLLDNPVLQFQKKYFHVLSFSLVFMIPVLVPVYFWHESINTAHHVSLLRLCLSTHAIYSIDSFAHLFSNKPHDKIITPAQNISASMVTFEEDCHNDHKNFPFDYRISELGNHYLSLSKNFIGFFGWIGWAYDLESTTNDVSRKKGDTTDGTDSWGMNDAEDKIHTMGMRQEHAERRQETF